jgi:hypothetical protein
MRYAVHHSSGPSELAGAFSGPKFLKPLLPDEPASVELLGEAPRWRFRVLRGDELLASGEIVAEAVVVA